LKWLIIPSAAAIAAAVLLYTAALTVQQTLIASQSIALGSLVPRTASLLPCSNTLSAMQSGMSGALFPPLFSASFQRTATGAKSFKLSRMDTHVELQGAHSSRLLTPMGTLVPAWTNAHWVSMRRYEGLRPGSAYSWLMGLRQRQTQRSAYRMGVCALHK
jgi:hypothetical protein